MKLNIYTGVIYKNPNPYSQIIFLFKNLKIFCSLFIDRLKNIFNRILNKNNNGWMILVGSEKLILSKWNNSSKSDSKFWLADPFKNQKSKLFNF